MIEIMDLALWALLTLAAAITLTAMCVFGAVIVAAPFLDRRRRQGCADFQEPEKDGGHIDPAAVMHHHRPTRSYLNQTGDWPGGLEACKCGATRAWAAAPGQPARFGAWRMAPHPTEPATPLTPFGPTS